MKPIAESCLQNQAEIYSVLKTLLTNKKHVLEIGSGTGQHAVYFAKRMPHLIWQTSDQQHYHEGIQLWLNEANLNNTPAPIKLDVSHDTWPQTRSDVVFSANVVHIMAWNNVIDYVSKSAQILTKEGLFILYGPFNYNNDYTSPSNRNFDQWLKSRDPNSGIRDFEALNNLATKYGLSLAHDIEMAANNRIICWQKN